LIQIYQDMKVLCFGIAREIIGNSELLIPNVEIDTVSSLKAYLKSEYPEFNVYKQFQIAVNLEFADDDRPICSRDEIAIIPPVSGG